MPDVRNPLPALFTPISAPLETLSKCYPSSKDSAFRKLVDLFSATTTLLEMQVSCLTRETRDMLKGASEVIKNGDAASRILEAIKKGDYLYSAHSLLSNALTVYVFVQKYFAPAFCASLNAATVSFCTNVALKTGNAHIMGGAKFVTGLGIEKIAKGATVLFLLVETVKIGKTLFHDGVKKQRYQETRTPRELFEHSANGTFTARNVVVCESSMVDKSEEELRDDIVRLEWKGFDLLLKLPCIILPFTSASLLTRNVVNATSGYISIVAAVA